MADDPDRDILPVKEGSCADSCRSNIDPRERHIVGKLERCELEDKYLRLLEEAHHLKKLTNRQEDKIKRLATKLMRATANTKSCSVSLDVYDNKNKLIALEIENAKLKDKIVVLRNQLLSHTISGRSSSRSRNQVRPSSGRITCRSENSRTKISCPYVENGNNEMSNGNNETANARSSLYKIEELEMEKEEMSSRIAQLEKELSASTVVSQREKIAENIKYIQVWRQMKQLNDKLIDAEQENESLNEQINNLKRLLEEATKKNEAIAVDLISERKRLDEETTKARNSIFSLREKDEQIKDLINEMKILQDHNNELIELSNKYGEVEMENMELKKKLNEQHDEEENLRNSFNGEQANIVALQASNEQLLGKLQELQKNIDTLTVQLTSFPTQTEKEEISRETQIAMKSEVKKMGPQEPYKDNSSQVEGCNKCCSDPEKKPEQNIAERVEQCKKCCMVAVSLEAVMHSGRRPTKLVDNSVQTDSDAHSTEKNEQDTGFIMSPVKEMPEKQESQILKKPVSRHMMTDGSALTPDKMLKLLDQAQIADHVDAQRNSQRSVGEFNELLEQHGRNSTAETIVQPTQEVPEFQPKPQPQEVPKTTNSPQPLVQSDSTKLLSLFYNILHEYNRSTSSHDVPSLYRPTIKQQCMKDVNNNFETAEVPARAGCNMRKCCSVPYNKFRQDKTKKRVVRKQEQIPVQNGIDDCSCTGSPDAACKMHCCSPSKSARCCNEMDHAVPQVRKDSLLNNVHRDEYSPKPNGAFNLPRRLTICDGSDNSSEKVANNVTISDETLHEYVKRLDKCREIMHGVANISVESPLDRMKIPNQLRGQPGLKAPKLIRQEIGAFCSLECTNDCVDIASPVPDSSPLVITDGQGLVELHIISLQLSTCAKEILFREKDLNDVSLFVSWDIWNQETAYTPTLKCPKLNFNSSFVYRISDLFSFFNYVLSDLVIFEVNVFHEDRDNYVVARGKLSVKDILDYPQNKLHYIAPVNSVIPCSIGMSFGQLSLWVRLSCDVEKVVQYKKQRGIHTQICEDVKPRFPPHKVSIISQPEVIEREEKLSDTVIETIPSTISDTYPTPVPTEQSTYQERPGFLTPQMTEMPTPIPSYRDDTSDSSGDVQLTKTRSVAHLSKDALTVVKESDEELERMYPGTSDSPDLSDPNKALYNNIKVWEEMTTSDEGNDRNDTDNNNENGNNKTVVADAVNQSVLDFNESISDSEEKDMISIEILKMNLFPKSFIMQNADLQLLYIEYCFLGYCGADMETVSLKKPELPNQSLTFNFKRKFRVDQEKHSLQNNILRAMLDESTNPNIKFIVVCEPLPEDTDTKECVEVGYAYFNIREYALGDSEKVVSLPIYNANDASDKIGLLTISVLGLDTIRQRLGRRESDTH